MGPHACTAQERLRVCSVRTAGDVSSGMELGLSFVAALLQAAIMPWAVQGVWAEGTPQRVWHTPQATSPPVPAPAAPWQHRPRPGCLRQGQTLAIAIALRVSRAAARQQLPSWLISNHILTRKHPLVFNHGNLTFRSGASALCTQSRAVL